MARSDCIGVEAGLILGLDPGTEETGWALYCPGEGISSGIEKNANMLTMIQRWEVVDPVRLAIEMFSSFGMPVGREVFETVWWIGRFTQAWHTPDQVRLVYRKDVKLHLCGSPRAKDANIRMSLIDKLGTPGTKKAQGGTYGVRSHAWAALGVAVTASEVSA